MSKELQQIGHGRSRAICVSAAKIREPGLNTGELDTNGVELVVKDKLGNPHYFPSEEKLLVSATGRSGISFMGVDNSNLINISGSNGQNIIESIDDVLVDIKSDVLAISGSTPSGVVLANGSVPYTANQSMNGYSITNAYGILSSASLTFGIDEDSNDSNNNFIWRNNGSLELMRLNDSGILGIGTNSPDVSARLDVSGTIKATSILLPHLDTLPSLTNGLLWTDAYGSYQRINGVTKRLDVTTMADISSESITTDDQSFAINTGTDFRIWDGSIESPTYFLTINSSATLINTSVGINGDVTIGSGSVSISSSSQPLNLVGVNNDIFLKSLSPSSYIYIQASESVIIDGKLELDASTASKAPLNIPQGVATTSLSNGDTFLTSAGSYQRINGVTRKLDVMSLYDVSSQSNSTSAQTFTIKNGTSLIFEDYNNTTIFNLSAHNFDMEINGPINFSGNSIDLNANTGSILLQASGSVLVGSHMELGGRAIYWYGDEDTDGSWKTIYLSNSIKTQYRTGGSWVDKNVISV